MFGSVRQHVTIRPAELRQKFGVTGGFAFAVFCRYFAAFCGPAGVNLNPLLIFSYQLVTNLPVGIQLLDDDDDVQ